MLGMELLRPITLTKDMEHIGRIQRVHGLDSPEASMRNMVADKRTKKSDQLTGGR